ncbi:unnamed protein product [Choristocarpus tenellus]
MIELRPKYTAVFSVPPFMPCVPYCAKYDMYLVGGFHRMEAVSDLMADFQLAVGGQESRFPWRESRWSNKENMLKQPDFFERVPINFYYCGHISSAHARTLFMRVAYEINDAHTAVHPNTFLDSVEYFSMLARGREDHLRAVVRSLTSTDRAKGDSTRPGLKIRISLAISTGRFSSGHTLHEYYNTIPLESTSGKSDFFTFTKFNKQVVSVVESRPNGKWALALGCKLYINFVLKHQTRLYDDGPLKAHGKQGLQEDLGKMAKYIEKAVGVFDVAWKKLSESEKDSFDTAFKRLNAGYERDKVASWHHLLFHDFCCKLPSIATMVNGSVTPLLPNGDIAGAIESDVVARFAALTDVQPDMLRCILFPTSLPSSCRPQLPKADVQPPEGPGEEGKEGQHGGNQICALGDVENRGGQEILDGSGEVTSGGVNKALEEGVQEESGEVPTMVGDVKKGGGQEMLGGVGGFSSGSVNIALEDCVEEENSKVPTGVGDVKKGGGQETLDGAGKVSTGGINKTLEEVVQEESGGFVTVSNVKNGGGQEMLDGVGEVSAGGVNKALQEGVQEESGGFLTVSDVKNGGGQEMLHGVREVSAGGVNKALQEGVQEESGGFPTVGDTKNGGGQEMLHGAGEVSAGGVNKALQEGVQVESDEVPTVGDAKNGGGQEMLHGVGEFSTPCVQSGGEQGIVEEVVGSTNRSTKTTSTREFSKKEGKGRRPTGIPPILQPMESGSGLGNNNLRMVTASTSTSGTRSDKESMVVQASDDNMDLGDPDIKPLMMDQVSNVLINTYPTESILIHQSEMIRDDHTYIFPASVLGHTRERCYKTIKKLMVKVSPAKRGRVKMEEDIARAFKGNKHFVQCVKSPITDNMDSRWSMIIMENAGLTLDVYFNLSEARGYPIQARGLNQKKVDSVEIMFYELFVAVQAMHAKAITQFDFMLQNIVVDAGVAKIIDFSSAVQQNSVFSPTVLSTTLLRHP